MESCSSSSSGQVSAHTPKAHSPSKLRPLPTKLPEWNDNAFPVGATLDNGKYVIVEKIVQTSTRDRGIYRGVRLSDRRSVVVTVGHEQQDSDYEALFQTFSWHVVEKVTELVHIGPLKYDAGGEESSAPRMDALVELEPNGEPLSKLLPDKLPKMYRMKVAYDCGIPLMEANEKGVEMDGSLRPEFIYVDIHAGHHNLIFQGLAPRATKFLSTAKRPSYGEPGLFSHIYAPLNMPPSVGKDAYNHIAVTLCVLTGEPPFVGNDISSQLRSVMEHKLRYDIDKLDTVTFPLLKELLKYGMDWTDANPPPVFGAIFRVMFQAIMAKASVDLQALARQFDRQK